MAGGGDQWAILVEFVKLIPLGDSRVTLELSGDAESRMEMYILLSGNGKAGTEMSACALFVKLK